MVKPVQRTKTIGTKVSEEECVQLEALAGSKTLGEWIREVLLRQVEQSIATPAEEVLLAELVGLRAILLNVLFRLANGEKITAEEMRQLIERADQHKSRKASERLAAHAPTAGGPLIGRARNPKSEKP